MSTFRLLGRIQILFSTPRDCITIPSRFHQFHGLHGVRGNISLDTWGFDIYNRDILSALKRINPLSNRTHDPHRRFRHRYLEHGETLFIPQQHLKAARLLIALSIKRDSTTECWNVDRPDQTITFMRKRWLPHILSYVAFVEPVSRGTRFERPVCFNTNCINPQHLQKRSTPLSRIAFQIKEKENG